MSGLLEQLSAVPIPDHAMPALGTDSEMVVWQPETDTIWEMWVAEKDANGNWSACYGGRMENASQKIGVSRLLGCCRLWTVAGRWADPQRRSDQSSD